MTPIEFKKQVETISGIVLFRSIQCKICSKQKELFDKVLKSYIDVECDDDPNYFVENHNIDVLPEVRIYENGKVVWSKIDFVLEEDIKFLENYV
jgi:hypothetical protein